MKTNITVSSVENDRTNRSGLYQKSSRNAGASSGSNLDLEMIRVPPANNTTKKKGIEPVLNKRRNQSRSNSRTTAPFLNNSGVFSQGGRNKNQPGRNYLNGNQT